MHGLINRSIQCFVIDTYGKTLWDDIVDTAGIRTDSFEAMLTYDTETTHAVVDAATQHLDTLRDIFLEDLGTYLVSHKRMQRVRRLLRLGGSSFVEFLFSLDDLQDRARMAVPDLRLPELELRDHFFTAFTLIVRHEAAGFGHVLIGLMRAMADDYGTLAIFQHCGRRDEVETVSVELIQMDFAEGRDFELARAP